MPMFNVQEVVYVLCSKGESMGMEDVYGHYVKKNNNKKNLIAVKVPCFIWAGGL